mgnify:CR=1 FL=1
MILGLILLLVLVYPANIYLAYTNGAALDTSPFIAWGRLPFQFVFIWKIESPANIVMIMLNLLSWALLSISSIQAGYKVQTGSLGWTSVYQGKEPIFPDMPTRGMFSIIRQPIYLSFSLVLWTSPQMSVDLFIVALSYSLYCYFGPMLKEKRFYKIYGNQFTEYQERVPYYLPLISRYVGPFKRG